MDIFEDLKRGEKISTSITIDKKLLQLLEKYKSENEIKSLSPMINTILWDWINKRGK